MKLTTNKKIDIKTIKKDDDIDVGSFVIIDCMLLIDLYKGDILKKIGKLLLSGIKTPDVKNI